MQGTLFKYGPNASHLAFMTGRSSKALVVIGGLSDGLMFAPYVSAMAPVLLASGWSLVQAQLSSSYQGCGVGSLDQDADEMLLLSRCLAREHGVEAVVLMGHSTGCQDIVRYMQRYGAEVPGAVPVAGTILQAPVSDHEWLSMFPVLEQTAAKARSMSEDGAGNDIVCRLKVLDNNPMTAQRFLSLYGKGGDDDMFSDHLLPEDLKRILTPAGVRPCLLLISGADETVPKTVDYAAKAERLATAVGPSAVLVVVNEAPHNLAGHEEEAVNHVKEFLGRVNYYIC